VAAGSGPIPKVGGFWFFNYQGVRARNGIDPNGSSTAPVVQAFPTAGDGTTNATLLAGAFGLTPAQIDPVAVNILNLKDNRFGGQYLVPRVGQGGCGKVSGATFFTQNFNCSFSAIAPIRDNQYTVSYDRSFRGDKDKITGTWFWDEGSVAKPFGTDTSLTNPRNDFQWNRYLAITETHLFSPTKVNELRLGYSRFLFGNVPVDTHSSTEIGATTNGNFPGMYRVSVTGLFSLGTASMTIAELSRIHIISSRHFPWSPEKHSLRMGGEAVQYQLNRFNNFAVRGSLTFGATSSGLAGPPPALTNCTLDNNECTAFQNFLRGRITAVQSAFGDPARNFIATDFAGFFQDDYRYTSRLTFNMGLRWKL